MGITGTSFLEIGLNNLACVYLFIEWWFMCVFVYMGGGGCVLTDVVLRVLNARWMQVQVVQVAKCQYMYVEARSSKYKSKTSSSSAHSGTAVYVFQ